MFSKPSRLVDRVFLHCSASDVASHDNIATIRDWHVNGNGWRDVGYHYFIRKSGKLEEGRPIGDTPAAQKNHNSGTIAICLHGLDEDKFTDAQFDKLKELCLEINNAYDGELTFHGHNEVANKACPVFDHRKVLKLDRFGRLGLTGAKKRKLDNVTDKSASNLPQIKRGARGAAVELCQKLLMLKVDGIFGPRTDAAVRDFQTANSLARDGVVGENTWKKLLTNRRIEHSGNT